MPSVPSWWMVMVMGLSSSSVFTCCQLKRLIMTLGSDLSLSEWSNSQCSYTRQEMSDLAANICHCQGALDIVNLQQIKFYRTGLEKMDLLQIGFPSRPDNMFF